MKLDYFKTETGTVILVAFLFVLSQLVFFPSIFTSSDEHHFIATSLQLQEGKLGEENPLEVCNAGKATSQGFVYGQYIGRSIFLIPFTWFGLNGVMLSGIILHLINLAILTLIFKKLSIRKEFALLYLFYPVAFWQARTLYAGLLVLTAFLSAFYFFISKKEKHWTLSGFFFGLAMLSRYDAALGIAGILLALLIKDRKKLLFVLAGFVPIVLLLFAFNISAFGSAVSIGHGSVSPLSFIGSTFTLTNIAALPLYIIALLILYPLMIASPFLQKKFEWKLEFALFSLFYLFLVMRSNFLIIQGSIFSSVLQLRYALPLIGMLMVPYAGWLQSKKELKQNYLWVIIGLLFVGSLGGSMMHSNLINDRGAVAEQIYSSTEEGSLIIGSSDDCIYFLNGFFEERYYASVDLKQQLAGNPGELELESFIGENTYVIDLQYSNRVPGTGGRQSNTDAERAKLDEFISANNNNLELISEFNEPHSLKIYRWAE